MQNNTFKRGNSRNQTTFNRHQQAKTGAAFCDVSHDGREKLFVQRSDLVNSRNGLTTKAFAAVEQRQKNTEGRCVNYNNGQRHDDMQVSAQNTRANETNASNLARNNATNNSSNKRSYFEPYDPRRSPRKTKTCWNNFSCPRTDPAMGQYTQPQYMGYCQSNFQQNVQYDPCSQYQYRQATNAATAVAPNGHTIYIPLDNQQYEIKKHNHDMQAMPVGSELFALESEFSEFESNVNSVSSPRPVDFRGGLSQDDSGDSSDEVSYGEPSTDSEEDAATTDDSEYVDNCVSNVLKTLAESVHSMTVEESMDIAKRAVKNFEEMQESKQNTFQNGLIPESNLDRNIIRQPVNDSDNIDGSSTYVSKKSDSNYSWTESVMEQTNQQANQNHAKKATNTATGEPRRRNKCDENELKDMNDLICTPEIKYREQRPKTARKNIKHDQIQDSSIVAMSTYPNSIDNKTSLQTEHAANLWNESLPFNYEHIIFNQQIEEQWPPSSNSLEVNNTSYSDSLDNSKANMPFNMPMSSMIEGLQEEVNSPPKNVENCFPIIVQNNWLVPDENETEVKPEIVSPLNHSNDSCFTMPIQNDWLTPEQNIDSVEQMLSPQEYRPFVDAVYLPGHVMVDGQGYFESSNFQTVQDQTLYTPDNYTFEAYQSEAVLSTAPAYTFFIHDACPPPPPEVICHPDQQRVPGELITVTDAENYDPKINEHSGDANHDEFEAQSCKHQLSQLPHLDDRDTGSHSDHQYVTRQPSSTHGETNVDNVRIPYETWNADGIDAQQNDGQVNDSLNPNGQFFVSYDEENVYTDPESGLSYPAIHMTEDCLITVIFREGVCLEMSADQSLRLVNHEKKIVAAMSGNGKSTCLIHPAARIYQSETSVHAALYSNRRANMTDELVTFGNDSQSYKFDDKAIVPVDSEPNYMDLSGDESVKFLNTDDGVQPGSQELRQRTLEILAHAHFWKHGKCGSTVIINGTKAVQSDKGEVSVYCGPIKFIRLNPTRSIIRLKTRLLEVDIETNWNVKLSRGHLALNVSHLGFIVSNGKIKGCIDKDDKLQSFSLPDHRILMLGQALPQRRPGVPAWIRRKRNRTIEPEGDHSAYTRSITEDNNDGDTHHRPGFDH